MSEWASECASHHKRLYFSHTHTDLNTLYGVKNFHPDLLRAEKISEFFIQRKNFFPSKTIREKKTSAQIKYIKWMFHECSVMHIKLGHIIVSYHVSEWAYNRDDDWSRMKESRLGLLLLAESTHKITKRESFLWHKWVKRGIKREREARGGNSISAFYWYNVIFSTLSDDSTFRISFSFFSQHLLCHG